MSQKTYNTRTFYKCKFLARMNGRQGVLLGLFFFKLRQTEGWSWLKSKFEKLALAVKSTSQVVRHWVINLLLAINLTSMSMVC